MKISGKEIKCPNCGSTDIECVDQIDTIFDIYKTKNNKLITRFIAYCPACLHEEKSFTITVKGHLDITKVEIKED